ncbi:MAG: RNA-binding protein [Saprospiraceae bacterium]|nr:RNA-binding protein [Saprospiraceae bacterium]
MNIYVSNLGFDANDSDLRTLFSTFGEVSSAKVIMDKMSGRSRGFGFVEMSDEEAGKAAIRSLNNKDMDGRSISVSVAKDKSQLGSSTSFNKGFGGNSTYKKRY